MICTCTNQECAHTNGAPCGFCGCPQVTVATDALECPTCASPEKGLHPSNGIEGEMIPCPDTWHREEATYCSGNGDCVADTMFHQGLCPKCKPAQATVQDRLRFDCARGCYCLKCEAADALDAKDADLAAMQNALAERDGKVFEQRREIERLKAAYDTTKREHDDLIHTNARLREVVKRAHRPNSYAHVTCHCADCETV